MNLLDLVYRRRRHREVPDVPVDISMEMDDMYVDVNQYVLV